MTVVLGLVAFLAIIVVVVGVHEGGHFAAAKAAGIRVDEFAIGFGPRLVQRRRGDTVYAIRALPLGGFVKMPGMSELEEDDGGERGFSRAPLWRRMVVILAGVACNFLLAGLLFGVLEVPSDSPQVPAGGAAYTAGLRDGDVITAVGGTRLDTHDAQAEADALHAATRASRGAPLQVTFDRPGQGSRTAAIRPGLQVIDLDASHPLRLTDGSPATGAQVVVDSIDGHPVGTGDPAALASNALVSGHLFDDTSRRVEGRLGSVTNDDGAGSIGATVAAWKIGYIAGREGRAAPAAIVHGFVAMPREVWTNVQNIYDVLTTPNSGGISNFQGPVGIVHDTATATGRGWQDLVALTALISVSLGIVNVLPLPPFDGGRFALLVAEGVSRRRVRPRVELAFIAVGAALIAAFVILITINDIRNF